MKTSLQTIEGLHIDVHTWYFRGFFSFFLGPQLPLQGLPLASRLLQ